MLTIYFYPDCDKPAYIEATQKYQKIWNESGAKIVELIENISGLKFIESHINAIVASGIEFSRPLQLNSLYKELSIKKALVVHELCHRLMEGHGATSFLS